MLTVCHGHIGQRAAQIVPGAFADIYAVQIEVSGFNAGRIVIAALIVVIGHIEVERLRINDRVIFQFGQRTVSVDQRNGGDSGRRYVLVIRAVDDRQVVQQDITMQLALLKRSSIHGIPSKARACAGHCAEKHTAVDADQRTGILGQISLQILPADLHAVCCRACVEVDICICPGCSAVTAGRDLCAQPGHRRCFIGDIHPYADSRRRTVDGEIITQAQTCAVCAGQSTPVIFHLDRIMSEANDICILLVSIRYDGAFDHAAAARIMIGRDRIGSHALKGLDRGADRGVIPDVFVTAVHDHDGLFADVYSNRIRQAAVSCRNDGAAGVFFI